MFCTMKQRKKICEFLSMCEKGEIVFSDRKEKEEGGSSAGNRELIVGSIFRGIDLSKIHMEVYTKGRWRPYRVLDGEQILTAVLDFHNGKFPLSENFSCLPGREYGIGGMYFDDIMDRYPRAAGEFLNFELDFTVFMSDEEDSLKTAEETVGRLLFVQAEERENLFFDRERHGNH